jgi:antitoxin component YwqK of YwqJK toxin-antitoxin module
MPDEKNTPDQGEKTSKGKMLLGILVILCAVGGVALLFVAGQDELIPQIEGYGGNQNPFVGIPNLVMGVGSIVLLLILGSTLLGISAIGFAIWRWSSRPWRTVARLCAIVFVVIAVQVAIETSQENKQESERIRAANILRGHDFKKWSQPHAPGSFADYYDSGEKAVEGQYDVNKKMSGLWTQWRETGEVAGETMWVDGLRNGTQKSWPTDHVRPDEQEVRSGQLLHRVFYFADGQIKQEESEYRPTGYSPLPLHTVRYFANGQIMQESNVIVGEDGKWHDSTTGWYESGEITFQTIHIDSVLHSATHWYENGHKEYETFRHESRHFYLQRNWTASGVAIPCDCGPGTAVPCEKRPQPVMNNDTYCTN